MFTRLLVPLDGSGLAESVLPVVRRLAQILPCTISLLHVIEKNAPSNIHGDVHLKDAPEAEAYLDEAAERLRALGLNVDMHVHTAPQGDVPKCIAEHAVELDQDLIVLCSHGSGGVRRFVFGSNAEQVLTHGSTPVLLVQATTRGSAPGFGPERILALADNTPATRPALEIGSQLASAARAELHLLAVVPTLASMSAEEAAAGRLMPRATKEVLQWAAEETAIYLRGEVESLREKAVRAGGRVERGDAGAAVVAVAGEIHADLVILAVRGLAGISAFWANALTRRVAGAYDGALLLIPPARV